MFDTLSFPALVLVFLLAAVIVWIAGIQLSRTTDMIDRRFGLSQALGGLVFLAITTNLPEIAIVISASLTKSFGIAIGNILGGIAIQTVVLVILDGVGLRHRGALTYKAASLQLVLEGILVISILVITIMGTQLPSSVIFARLAPADLFIVITWIMGVWLISKARTDLPWHEKGRAPDTISSAPPLEERRWKNRRTRDVLLLFLFASFLTLIAGVILEESSKAIAAHIGWSGVLFGSTILAAITALPEISTGLAAVRMNEYTLAVSDIFGGNAFLPVLFFPATIVAGEPLLPSAQNTDIYLASLGALLTSVYLYGLIFRPKKQFFCLGIDSVLVLLLYITGIAGLFAISRA